ncbi:hypothetical protein SISNIDRAFT_414384 [Sistotremastrum niveocremeum HHB9708]|uniref:Peptidase A2 domain-containing protein n=1 Tax=Sistotremastrum niveocremeum HHB9708 TaxID=1314777 RepID=A0A164SBT4_9AGAM|nr:hypothetical protein SISNIDRAFT_420882 [Sistotremastrum niveocremeum HHB9708]KZS91327.1 hypothetical protein SISNIDRAFT_414384 [Sistotremastrum niveocremeum HHB9708]
MHGEYVVADHSLPLQEVATVVNGRFDEWGVLDDGSSIIVIREDLWKETMLPISPAHAMRMEGADTSKSVTLGSVQDLRITVGEITVLVQAQVVKNAPFRLLLGRPFFSVTQATRKDTSSGDYLLTI